MTRFTRILLPGAAALILLGVGLSLARAQKAAAPPGASELAASFGSLAPHLDLAPQGQPWRITASPAGEVVMENSTSPRGVTWRVMPEPGPRPLQVAVRVTTELVPGAPPPPTGLGSPGATSRA